MYVTYTGNLFIAYIYYYIFNKCPLLCSFMLSKNRKYYKGRTYPLYTLDRYGNSYIRRGNVFGRIVKGRRARWRATDGCSRGSRAPRPRGTFNTRLNNINYQKMSAAVAKKIFQPLQRCIAL